MRNDYDDYDDYDDYNAPRHERPRRRQIDFDDNDTPTRPAPVRGQRDSDWADDLATRADGRLRADSRRRPYRDTYGDTYGGDDDDDMDYAPRRRQRPTEPLSAPRRPRQSVNYDDDNNDMTPPRNESFRKRHPVLMNIIYIIAATALLLWLMMCFLDFWTFHGEERVVPDVKGQTFETAAGNVDISGLNAVISDSVFDSYNRPGIIVEQTPIPGARIKKGGNVYLTIVAFTPKLITVPDFYNASVRQARSIFEGLGIKEIREVPITSEYAGLVLGARFNGVQLQPGARIPVSAVITLEVGTGLEIFDETGADIDSVAIDNAIEELNID